MMASRVASGRSPHRSLAECTVNDGDTFSIMIPQNMSENSGAGCQNTDSAVYAFITVVPLPQAGRLVQR
jgi:hypothetical protein